MSAMDWTYVNRQLVAKALGELSYEQILVPTKEKNLSKTSSSYRLNLQSGVCYRFSAWRGIWDHLRVDPTSLTREVQGKLSEVDCAGQFFIDAQKDLHMTDIVLGNFLEEMQSTLFADLRLFEKTRNLSVTELARWKGNRLQSVLNGHPKIILNKGRLGWGAGEMDRYAPESGRSFQLHWIGVLKSRSVVSESGPSEVDLKKELLSSSEQKQIESEILNLSLAPEDYWIVPVHPWQWERHLRIQFQAEITNQSILSFGIRGDEYTAQISLRSLSNQAHPQKPDLKLSLSVLNTSAYRGISSKYILKAPALANALERICQLDPVLKSQGVEVVKDLWAFAYEHSLYGQIEEAPYRYKEMLGVVLRENLDAKLKEGELAVMTGVLFHQDCSGNSLIGEYIRLSGISTEDWLKRYFQSVVVPLYHLQLQYGLGLVAHGQNILLRMKNYVPTGLFLKDFQGDLRLSKEENALQKEFLGNVSHHLDRLPKEYLIHDLITGHLVTVLRFVSEVLQESDGFPETEFYKILAEELKSYLAKLPKGSVRPEENLLSEKFARVLLNKVRFKVGYGDSSERPLPLLGTDLANPLRGEVYGIH